MKYLILACKYYYEENSTSSEIAHEVSRSVEQGRDLPLNIFFVSETDIGETMSKFQPRTKRMFTGTAVYHRADIVRGQLDTAIRLFLDDGCDMFSAITLAGAAGDVLHQLVLDSGKSPFVDSAAKVHDWKKLGQTPSRNKLMTRLHEILSTNKLKHLDKGGETVIELDAEECALCAILKAVVDFKTYTEHESVPMKEFLAWTYRNLEPNQFLKEYEDFSKANKAHN